MVAKIVSGGPVDMALLLVTLERHLTASWSLNTDLGRLLTQFFSL
jgi:hypothetical protein